MVVKLWIQSTNYLVAWRSDSEHGFLREFMCLSISYIILAQFPLHWITGSAVTVIALRRVFFLLLPVQFSSLHLSCVSKHYNRWTIFLQRKVHHFPLAFLQVWSKTKKCCHVLVQSHRQENSPKADVKEEGDSRGILCSLHEAALPRVSVTCLCWLVTLSFVQTLLAEEVNGRNYESGRDLEIQNMNILWINLLLWSWESKVILACAGSKLKTANGNTISAQRISGWSLAVGMMTACQPYPAEWMMLC